MKKSASRDYTYSFVPVRNRPRLAASVWNEAKTRIFYDNPFFNTNHRADLAGVVAAFSG